MQDLNQVMAAGVVNGGPGSTQTAPLNPGPLAGGCLPSSELHEEQSTGAKGLIEGGAALGGCTQCDGEVRVRRG